MNGWTATGDGRHYPTSTRDCREQDGCQIVRREPDDPKIDGPENHYAAEVADAIDDKDDEEDSDYSEEFGEQYSEEDSDKETESQVNSNEETGFEDDSDGEFLRGEEHEDDFGAPIHERWHCAAREF